ncbi:MAG TPA: hypothetical protein VNW92_02470 [Polyangiaceae bacterium]|jgi:hypothetical protein|nr:hypothetical protein [Polyangiaceae bacterium]
MHFYHRGLLAVLFGIAISACSSSDSKSDSGTAAAGAAGTASAGSGEAGSGGSGSDDIASAILGTWTSTDCELLSTTLSRRRTYVFAPTDVKITYDVFGGTTCDAAAAVFTVTTHGNADFVGPSPTLPGVTNVVFTFKSRALTPTAAGLSTLKTACPAEYSWVVGTETDVTKDGCDKLQVQSDTECPVEYDLAEIKDGVAYFGDRSVPLCSEATRPKLLQTTGVAKQP